MIFIITTLAIVALGWVGWNLTLDALWQPSDHETISLILETLEVSSGDLVYDLGCGDGRWLTRIVKDRGARAIGVEIDPVRAIISRLRLILSGSSSRAKVIWGNMYKVDLTGADAVILFLSEEANKKLSSKFNRELTQGARVASFYHKLPGWDPVNTKVNNDGYKIYLYRKRGQ
ncbi:class I SAM-dependent methyltransferase [Candidatus Bipolaricaulota bacterium]|nr:class I SAM-dependent methyltransferase [Candidatus Bipolaricaulota bacterium]